MITPSERSDSVIIRELRESDAAALLHYCKIIGGESHNLTFGSEGIGMTLEEEQKFIRDTIHHPLNRQWAAIVNHEIAGFCDLHIASKPRMAHRAALYERFGFQKVGYLQKFFRIDKQEFGAYIMDCDLTKRRG